VWVLPVSLTVTARVSSPEMLFWIWISIGILVLCFGFGLFWCLIWKSFHAGRGCQPLDQAQNIFPGFALVTNFIHVPAGLRHAPASRRIVVVRLRFAGRDDRGIKLRP